MRLPRSRIPMPIIAAAVVGLSLVATAFWLIILPTWDQWETSKSYLARSQDFAFALSLVGNFADIDHQSERIQEIGENDFKDWVRAMESLKILSYPGGLFEISRRSNETEQACQEAWLKYEKLSNQEKIAWWKSQTQRTQRLADYLARMKRKYEIAADRPWLPIPADPPPPE